MAQIDPDEYVTVVHPYDVLFGRGSGPNDHEGNIRFRDMVSQRKVEYMATNHRQTKAKIAKSIVDTVFDHQGRFLKKLEPSEVQALGYSNDIDVYAIVDDATIMEKAKQALRQNREKLAVAAGFPNTTEMNMHHQAMDASGDDVSPKAPQSVGNMSSPYGDQFDVMSEPLPVRGSSGDMMNLPSPTSSSPYVIDEKPIYRDDTQGYATYTTTLEDPEDARLFQDDPTGNASSNRRQVSSNMMTGSSTNVAAGSRRGSLLGARKDGTTGNRRGSMPIDDVWRRDSLMNRGESMQMSDLMGSFKGMSTSEMNSSSDTIGTIEGNMMYGNNQSSGISNMSAMSISSTTSLFKMGSGAENESLKSGESPAGPDVGGGGDVFPVANDGNAGTWNADSNNTSSSNNNNSGSNPCQQSMPPPGGVNHRGSMIPRDMWTSGTLTTLLQAPMEGSSALLALDSSGAMPRHVQLMEEQPDSLGYLGASSLSVMRAAELSSTSFRSGAGGGVGFNNTKSNNDRILPLERQ